MLPTYSQFERRELLACRLSRRFLVLAALLLGSLSSSIIAQEEKDETPLSESPITERTGNIQPLGPPLFPFYDHYLRKSDQTEILNVLYLYRSTERPNGDESTFLLPFYYRQKQETPRDNRFHLFPLLYFSRDSEEHQYNFSPLYFHSLSKEAEHRFLNPLWYNYKNFEENTNTHHVLFPLSSFTSSNKPDEEPNSGFRVGLWRTLEVAQAYSTERETRVNVLSLFDIYGDSKTPLALFRHKRTPSATHTHLFPLFWSGGTDRSAYTMLFPAYGYSKLGTQSDHWFPLILSRFGGREEGISRQDVLFPLIQRRTRPGYSRFRFSPLFDYEWTPEHRSWGLLNVILGNILYQNDYTHETDKTAHSFLSPLGRVDFEPDGSKGHARFLPFYWDSFDNDSRFIWGTTFLNYQWRAGKKLEYEFLYGMPTYFHWGSPNDYFGMGFPLYWEGYRRPHAWNLFIPFYFSFSTRASHGVHVFPLFSYNNYPSEVQLSLLGPLLIHQQFYNHLEESDGFSTSLLWPFIQVKNRSNGYHYRLLPLGWIGKEDEERDFLLFPLLYRQWGGDRSQNYFFPVYGRYDSKKLTRDFYGLGTYVKTEERTEEGEVFRTSTDVLWPLYSNQTNKKTNLKHQRLLPLGYWNTESPLVDRKIVGPFYYGHRVDTEETRKKANLFMGNLFLSLETQRPIKPKRKLSPLKAKAEAIPTEKAPNSHFKTVASEKGVLWPLTRWGKNEQGEESSWVLPFFYRTKSPEASSLGLFPFFFNDEMKDRYNPSYFRYFYLFARDKWPNGHRFSILQLAFDWMADEKRESYRWRALYPLMENSWDKEGYSYQLTPLLQGEVREQGGIKKSSHFLFPLLWFGSEKNKGPNDTYESQSDHFLLFPLYGYSEKELRTTHNFLLPFFHAVDGVNSFKFQVRPFIYYRNDPEEHSFRFWPFHTFESGESAGEWWVSKYLFLSRTSVKKESHEFRLDPFIFRTSSTPDSFGIGGLFELWAYDRKGAETDMRMLPFLYGYSHQKEAGLDFFPFYHSRNNGDRPIQFLNPLRLFYLSSHLRGNDYQYTSFLTLLSEYESNAKRPEYSDFRFLFRLIQRTKTETSSTFAFYPFFRYHRDDAELSKQIFCLFPGYRYEERAGKGRHYLFWFIPISG